MYVLDNIHIFCEKKAKNGSLFLTYSSQIVAKQKVDSIAKYAASDRRYIMRIDLNDILSTTDASKKEAFIKQYEELKTNILFFETELDLLRKKIHAVRHQQLESANLFNADQIVMNHEFNALTALISTLTHYLEMVKSHKLFDNKITLDKMTDEDFLHFENHVKVMRQMCDLIGKEDTATVTSQLIKEAGQLNYKVSYTRAWLRRGATLIAGLVAAAVTVVGVFLMMTPAVHIGAAFTGLGVSMLAALAYFGIGSSPVVHTNVNMGIFSANISTTVPSTAGTFLPAIFGLSFVNKMRITNPVREEAARNTQAATINLLTEKLYKTINNLPENDVKIRLLQIVQGASTMFNEGVSSRWFESQQSKMEKGRLILQTTAAILEAGVPANITQLFDTKVGNTTYTFGQLLNAQRNISLFSNRTAAIAKMCNVLESQHKAVDLTVFAAA